MRGKARISGTVTYLNAKGQRLQVPEGPCEIEELAQSSDNYVLYWKEGGHEKAWTLTLPEFAQYTASKDLVVLE